VCCPRPHINQQQQYPVRALPEALHHTAPHADYLHYFLIIFLYWPIDVPANMKQSSITQRDRANQFDNAVHSHCCVLVSITPILRLLNQPQVARMYDVFGRWILSSKCYLAAFIAIISFLMWPNIILEFHRNILRNINVIRAAVSEELGLLQKPAYTNII
jgi:hypothetical protein